MKTYIGIDLGGTNVRCATVQPDGTVLETVKGPSHAKEGADAIISNIVSLIKHLHNWQDAAGIGIAVPGPVARDGNGMAMATNIPVLAKYPLRDTLQNELHIPCVLGNDADAAGLAEALVGAGKGLRTVVYITLSTGIGGAIIYNGQLLPGSHGYSMEVASMSVDGSRPKVNLPANGAVEDWASGTSVTRLGNEKIPGANFVHAGQVFDQAEQNVGQAVAIADQVTTDLAVMFGNLATTIDPDCFILGGGMMKSAGYFLPKVKEKYKQRVLPALTDTPFLLASLEEPGVVGAAMLPMSNGL
jgi:glucokinase